MDGGRWTVVGASGADLSQSRRQPAAVFRQPTTDHGPPLSTVRLAFATPWSVSTGFSDRQLTSRFYAGGAIVGEFDQLHNGFNASYGLALSPDDSRATRLSFGVDWQSDEFQPIALDATVPLPEDREYRYMFVGYEFARNRFAKVNFLNLDQRYEDLRIGSRVFVRFGVSPTLFGADETIVGRVSINHGSDLDPDMQFFADGSTGLRGYRLHSFAGDSSMVLNLEHRIYLGREIWKFLSPGVAFFVDAGTPPMARRRSIRTT